MRRFELDSDTDGASPPYQSDMDDEYSASGQPGHYRTFSSSSYRSEAGTPPGSPHRSTTAARVVNDEAWRKVPFGLHSTLRFRMIFFEEGKGEASPWHDVPLLTAEGLFNFVCKTPRDTWQQFEVAKSEPLAPLKLSKGSGGGPVHYAENAKWNYGMLPQTYSEPGSGASEFGFPCDGAPVEVVEIGNRTAQLGDVYLVKPLAAYLLIDITAGHLAFKVIAIAADDPMADRLDDIADITDCMPGTLEAVREWLRMCHRSDLNDPENVFGMNQRALGAEEVAKRVAKAHADWKDLTTREPPAPLVGAAVRAAAGEPRTAAEYERLWERHVARESFEKVALCDSYLGSTAKLDRAWVEDEPSPTASIASDGGRSAKGDSFSFPVLGSLLGGGGGGARHSHSKSADVGLSPTHASGGGGGHSKTKNLKKAIGHFFSAD